MDRKPVTEMTDAEKLDAIVNDPTYFERARAERMEEARREVDERLARRVAHLQAEKDARRAATPWWRRWLA